MSAGRAGVLALGVLGLVAGPGAGEARAWPQEAYRNMAYDTLRMLPPRLARVLLARDDAVVSGAFGLEGETAARLARDGSRGRLSEELVADVEERIARAAQVVSEHRGFDELAGELGKLLRIAADLSDPAIVGAGRAEVRRMAPEYYRFVDLNLPKFPLVHHDRLPSTVHGASVASLLAEVHGETSAALAPLAGAFWRDGRVMPAESFDYRSVPYAETSLSYSRAVTAASYLWLAAWKQANGDFTGYRYANGER